MTKRVTIKDIARTAGVTPSTVSCILNDKDLPFKEETVLKVKRIAKELGYSANVLARGLVRGKTNTVAILFVGNTSDPFSSPFLLDLISVICSELDVAGYSILFNTSPKNPTPEALGNYLKDFLQSGRADGLIIIGPPRLSFHEVIRSVDFDTNCILLGRVANMSRLNMVDVDNERVGYMAGKYLLDKGSRRPCVITHDADFQFPIDRRDGFIRACRERAVAFDYGQVVIVDDLGVENLQANLERIHAAGHIDGVYAMNLNAIPLINLYQALANMGLRVPEDVRSICDEERNSQILRFPVPAIRIDSHALGRNAVRMILEKLGGRAGYAQEFIDPDIVE
jgi:LacI family transcriptional regulator